MKKIWCKTKRYKRGNNNGSSKEKTCPVCVKNK